MKILFIHQGFPGQFKNLVPALLERRDQVFVLSSKVKPLNLDPRIHYTRYVSEEAILAVYTPCFRN